MKTKETLQAQVSSLEVQIEGLNTKVQELENELSTTKHEISVINKPTMTENVYELLQDTIREAVDNFEFDSDNFDWEPTWHGREVELDYLQFRDQDSMSSDIIRCIDREFRVIENDDLPLNSGDIAVEQTAAHA